jgi:branched-chain amino acid transport system substrate-binding protein
MTKSQGLNDRGGTTRRTLLKIAGAGAVSVVGAPLVARAAGQPIVIGLQTELTGILTTYGYWYEKAARAAVDRINKQGGIAGRQVVLAVENTATKVDVGTATTEKLITREKADFLIGSLHTGIATGSAKICRDLNTLYFSCAKADEMTGEAGNRFLFRICSNSEMEAQASVSPALVNNLGKKWSVIYADYSWGQSHLRVWKSRLVAAGAEVLSEVGVPLGTSDMLPYIAKVDRGSQAVLVALFTSDAIGYTKQRSAMGVKSAVFGVQGLDAAISPSVLRDAAGFYVPHSLPRELAAKDTPSHRAFRAALGVEPNGKEVGSDRWIPESYYWTTWEYVNLIKKGVEATGWGSKADNPKLIGALEGMTMEESDDFPQGTKTIRPEDHQAFVDMYISRITAEGRPEVLSKVERAAGVYPAGVDYRKQSI